MELQPILCPVCGAQLHFTDDQDFCFCSHCGTQIHKDDKNNIRITKTTVVRDEAQIIKAQNKAKELDYKERSELLKLRKLKMIFIFSLIILFVAIICCYLIYRNFGGAPMAVFIELIFAAIILVALIRHNKESD